MLNKDQEINKNSSRFYTLAGKLETILEQFAENVYVINNPNVHISRNHPEYLGIWAPVIYESKISKQKILKTFIYLILSFLLNLFHLLKEVLNMTNLKKLNLDSVETTNYFIVSHSVSSLNEEKDFYYGDIISYLVSRNKKVIRLLIPHGSKKIPFQIKKPVESITLNFPLGISTILKYLIFNIYALFQLVRHCMHSKFSFYEILCVLIGQLDNFPNFKISTNLRHVVSKVKASCLIATFEGNPLERSAFLTCHEYDLTSIGYQHAPLIRDQYSIFRTLPIQLNPDWILTSGTYTQEIFRSKLKSNVRVEVLGSTKYIDNANNLEYLISLKSPQVLLVPDGNIHSLETFVELGIELSKCSPNINFLIRSHPLFQGQLQLKMNNSKVESNFMISNNSLDVDLNKSRWVLYENSSVAVQSGFYGCQLIYVPNNFANVDPLFDSTFNKITAYSVEEICLHVNSLQLPSFSQAIKNYKFCESYFAPLDYTFFDSI